MPMKRTVRLTNLAASEWMQLELMLPLLDRGTGRSWQPTEEAGADVALVDLDRPDGPEALADARRHDGCVVGLTAACDAGDVHCLQRPLRAAALAQLLRTIDGSGATAAPHEPTGDESPIPGPAIDTMGYRLVRWPSTDTMRAEPDFLRVCGALVRRPRSLDAVSRHLGLDVDTTADRLARLEGLGSVERTAIPAPEAGTPGEETAQGLMARLRNRLGVG